MLTDRAVDAPVAMCENGQALAKFMFRCKGIDRSIYEISVFYGFPINYSTNFRNDDFSSFRNYTKDWQDCASEK